MVIKVIVGDGGSRNPNVKTPIAVVVAHPILRPAIGIGARPRVGFSVAVPAFRALLDPQPTCLGRARRAPVPR